MASPSSLLLKASFSPSLQPLRLAQPHNRTPKPTSLSQPTSLSPPRELKTHHNLHISSSSRMSLQAASLRRRGIVTAAASFEDSASLETEVKAAGVEEINDEPEKQTEHSKDAWSQAVENLKEEVVKVTEASKQSAEESTEKVIGAFKDTTEQLKEQAEKARAVLAATAQETAEKGKENLTLIAENAPDPIKDIAETALTAHTPEMAKKGAKIHDFCLGIPYGGFLVFGGLLWFIISGNTAAIRFGVILGGTLLALSISSLKAWKQGRPSMPYIKGQAGITLVILIREIRRYFETHLFFPTAIAAIVSAGMLGFYSYVYYSGGNPPKKVKEEPAT